MRIADIYDLEQKRKKGEKIVKLKVKPITIIRKEIVKIPVKPMTIIKKEVILAKYTIGEQ